MTTKQWEVLADRRYDAVTGTLTAATAILVLRGFLQITNSTTGEPKMVNGKLLPNTAGNAFNYLFLGLLIVSMKLTLVIRRRRLSV